MAKKATTATATKRQLEASYDDSSSHLVAAVNVMGHMLEQIENPALLAGFESDIAKFREWVESHLDHADRERIN